MSRFIKIDNRIFNVDDVKSVFWDDSETPYLVFKGDSILYIDLSPDEILCMLNGTSREILDKSISELKYLRKNGHGGFFK